MSLGAAPSGGPRGPRRVDCGSTAAAPPSKSVLSLFSNLQLAQPQAPQGHEISISREKWNVAGNFDESKFMGVHLSLLEEFIQYCKSKKEHTPVNLNGERPVGCSFKEKLVFYFGEHLPPNVIDKLCNIVDENSYGKCHYCMLPSESLVLSVLQVLLDASKENIDRQDDNCPIKSPPLNANVANNVSASSNSPVLRGSNAQNAQRSNDRASNQNFFAQGEAGFRFQHIGEDTIFSVDCQGNFVEPMCPENQDTHGLGRNAAPIIESPRLLNARKDTSIEPYGHQGMQEKTPVAPVKKRSRQQTPLKIVSPLGSKESEMVVIDPANKAQEKMATSVSQYAPLPQFGSVCRFPISDKELQYYKIICGLAHSQWRMYVFYIYLSWLPGVLFYKTTVTYQSLGESLEPNGHVDNFFIAAVCWKNFEDNHPKLSKKHYFYPRIGGCLLRYSSLSDVLILKHSFLGANAANKLHCSHKLCFPIHHENHWFVFIVDLDNKYFVFLDSYYNQNDMYQLEVRDRLVTSFKRCWYAHAEDKLDLEQFRILYPPVPKQSNPNDCGIFSVMFLERWDVTVDLRLLFDYSDIENIRVKLTNSLFFSPSNSVGKDLVNYFYEQGYDPRVFT